MRIPFGKKQKPAQFLENELLKEEPSEPEEVQAPPFKRVEFEECFMSAPDRLGEPEGDFLGKDKLGRYIHPTTQEAWIAWNNAAQLALNTVANRCERHYTNKDRVDWTRDPYITTLQCAQLARDLIGEE
jgi:hypothetical protein